MGIFADKHIDHTSATIGGKALNLLRLENLNIRVPEWQVIDQSVIQKVIGDATTVQEVESRIDNFSLDDDFQNELSSLFSSVDGWFAVRSSAVMEDGVDHSFAGQFETFLYVKPEDVASKVKDVWRSTCSERVMTYCREKGIPHNFGIAVIVQKMVDADASGVAFGANPTSGSTEESVICSVYGVGEGIVSGELNADTFVIKNGAIDKQVIDKPHALKQKPEGGLQKVDVPPEERLTASINDPILQEINSTLDLLEKELGQPQDVEFAVRDNTLVFLQTRPITTIDRKQSGEKIIWDNSNIVESYPGVTTPLTFSYILRGYRNVYLQLARIMGASEKVLQENMVTFENMLGLIHGRVYYNLLSWYKVLAIFPGYSLNARFMENMMGVKERFDIPKNNRLSRSAAYYRIMIMFSRIMKNLFTIKKQTRRFLKEVDEIITEFKAMDLDRKDAYELMELFRSIDARLLKRWKAPLVNDSFAMIYFGKLQKLIEEKSIGDNPNLHNDLMCGNSDIISVEPVRKSIRIATVIAEDDKLKALFTDNKGAEIWSILKTKPTEEPYKTVKDLLDDYIHEFGDRCIGELKLETISYSQDPSILIDMIKGLVIQGVTTSSFNSEGELEIRHNAEKEARKALRGRPLLRRKFYKTLRKARYFVSNRENLRYDRTRVFGVTRAIFNQIGKRFAENGVLNSERDIYYLSIDEIFGFIQGTSHDVNLKALVDRRKQEYREYEQMNPPSDRIVTYGTVNEGNDFYPQYLDEDIEGDLTGIGCCPGTVKAKVRVVRHPSEVESLNGDILVTTSTDPGWVTLFPTASAIIVERGSLLSHSAIVSREMGIPCIVSVTGLLKKLNTGDVVEMDGRKGTIKILETHGE